MQRNIESRFVLMSNWNNDRAMMARPLSRWWWCWYCGWQKVRISREPSGMRAFYSQRSFHFYARFHSESYSQNSIIL